MEFYVYILRSDKDKGLYVGMTSDIAKRVAAHNAGSTSSTKRRRPFTLVYSESYADREVARKREKFLKSYAGSSEKRQIVENCQIV